MRINPLRPDEEVWSNLEGVVGAIEKRCLFHSEKIQGAQWVQAGSLLPGDLVFFGRQKSNVPIESVDKELADETVNDIKVENAHSFLTEVCAVHNCGSSTTAYVAEIKQPDISVPKL